MPDYADIATLLVPKGKAQKAQLPIVTSRGASGVEFVNGTFPLIPVVNFGEFIDRWIGVVTTDPSDVILPLAININNVILDASGVLENLPASADYRFRFPDLLLTDEGMEDYIVTVTKMFVPRTPDPPPGFIILAGSGASEFTANTPTEEVSLSQLRVTRMTTPKVIIGILDEDLQIFVDLYPNVPGYIESTFWCRIESEVADFASLVIADSDIAESLASKTVNLVTRYDSRFEDLDNVIRFGVDTLNRPIDWRIQSTSRVNDNEINLALVAFAT